jgi:hypothetical protein
LTCDSSETVTPRVVRGESLLYSCPRRAIECRTIRCFGYSSHRDWRPAFVSSWSESHSGGAGALSSSAALAPRYGEEYLEGKPQRDETLFVRIRANRARPRREVASATVGAQSPECCRRGFGQQAGSHGLGGLVQERTLSRSGSCGDNLKSLFRGKEFLPGRLAENRDGNGSLPRPRNPISEKVASRPSSL